MNDTIQNDTLQKVIDGLSPSQREAVLHRGGPELVIAGAGSGKTRVLAARCASLMAEGVPPERILALTFTRKAATEMKDRIAAITGEDALRLQAGTFHSLFIRLLRPYAHLVGFPENFTILDEEDSRRCIGRCTRAVLSPGEGEAEEDTGQDDRHAPYRTSTVAHIISSAKNRLCGPDAYADDEERRRADIRDGQPLTGSIYRLYQETTFRCGTMDFDDILYYTYILLERFPSVRKVIASSFDHILVDEYQDTNLAQYRILRLLTLDNRNICAVGDDSQSIYAFRGARIENIIRFKDDYPGTKIIRLEENYRSTSDIVDAANRLIAHNENRIPKTCLSTRGKGPAIRLKECTDERHEANLAAAIISSRMQSGENARYGDFALLYRTNSQSRALEESLMRRHIPYTIYSGTAFFSRSEVKDLLAYFKMTVNPNDDESFRRAVNRPARGVGSGAIGRLQNYATDNQLTLWQTVCSPALYDMDLGPKALSGIETFRNLVLQAQEISRDGSASAAAKWLSDTSGLIQEHAAGQTEEERARADNLQELLDAVKSYEEETEKENRALPPDRRTAPSLRGFMENVLLLSNADTDGGDGDRAALMTVHSAKGLEFPCVFVTGMEQGLFPLLFDPKTDDIEEERRLFYVAVTRAEKDLFILRARRRLRGGRRLLKKESQFIKELTGEAEEDGERRDIHSETSTSETSTSTSKT